MTLFPGAGHGRGCHDVGIDAGAWMRRRGFVSRLLLAGQCLSLALLSACQSPEEQADALMQRAAQLAEVGDRIGAIEAAHEAIALRDNKADYFLMLAQIHLRAGDQGDAYRAAERALELDAANVNALTVVANVGLQVGQIDAASSAADRLLALDPNSLIGLQVKGLVELYRDRNEAAAATAQRLLTLNPSDEAGMIIQTRVLAKAGKLEEALAFNEEAIRQSSASAALLITNINLNRALGRPDAMAEGFKKLAELIPSRNAELILDEINLTYKLGRAEQARALTRTLLARTSFRTTDLAILQRLWWEYDPVPFTRETIKAASEWRDPMVLLSVGRYLLWKGQPQLADDLYFSFPETMRPVGISIHLRAAFALGRAEQARKDMEQVLAGDPGNVDALLLQSQLHERSGRLDLALEAAQRAMNSDQTDPEVYVVQARLQAKAGAAWRSAQIFEEGLQQMPQNFLLIERYTQFLHDSGNKSRAVSVSRSFARALPSSVRAWTIMAQQCAWAGDAACAAEAAAGKAAAAKRYNVDDPPGAAPDRGLIGKF